MIQQNKIPNKRTKRVFIYVLAVMLLCGICSGAAAAAGSWSGDEFIPDTDGYSSASVLVSELNNGSTDIAEESPAGTVKLLKNVTFGGQLKVVNGAVTIDLNGNIIKAAHSNSVFAVRTGGDLTLKDSNPTRQHYFSIDADGLYKYKGETQTGGLTEVTGGCVTGGNTNGGGGVFVTDGGTFSMTGGNIVGNNGGSSYGGGVYVRVGTFTMIGGSIVGNIAGNGGGVCLDESSAHFIMTGGSVTSNHSTASDGWGGGVYVRNGSFELSGGDITHNTTKVYGGGVCINNQGTFMMSGGSIANNTAPDGGGVCVRSSSSQFTMTGGSITGNSAIDRGNDTGWGGGVYVKAGAFALSGPGTISGNHAVYGGGVCVGCTAYPGIFTMSAGSITGNEATVYGCGVYARSGTFTITGGSITGNASSGSDVCVNPAAAFTQTGGDIGKIEYEQIVTVTFTDGTHSYTQETVVNKWFILKPVSEMTLFTPPAGKQFVGWVNETTGRIYVDQQPVRTSANMTLNPVWAAAGERVTITFTDGTDTRTQKVSVNEWTTLNPVAFAAPAGKEFIGWKDETNMFYTDKQAVKLIAPLTLTAQWAEVQDWDGKTDITASGYYRLSGDAAVTQTIAVNAAPVVIDLNGNVLVLDNGKSGPVLKTESDSVVTLMDTGAQNTVHYFSITPASVGTLKFWKLCSSYGAKPADASAANTVDLESIRKYDDWGSGTVRYVSVPGGCIAGGSADKGGGVCIGSGCVFTQNGGYIAGNTAANSGGGVYNNTGTYTLNGGGVVGNCAAASGTICFGGGISNDVDGTVVLSSTGCIVGNSAKNGGGGVSNILYSEAFVMNGGRIDANSAGTADAIDNDGGGVSSLSLSFVMNRGSISGNKAAGHGGGLHNEKNAVINGGEISWNYAGRGGGVDNVILGILTINGGDIIHNSAKYTGGGVRNCYGAGNQVPQMFIHGGNISCNYAGTWGGGIINAMGKLVIDENAGLVTITYNTAHEEGGGIDNNEGGDLTIKAGTIGYNTAELYNGGGINNYADDMTKIPTVTRITGGYVINNHSGDCGGGVYMSYYEYGADCDLFISGNPVINGNTSDALGGADNVYLEPWDEAGLQRYITLTGKLSAGADIHISYPAVEGDQFGVVSDDYTAKDSDAGYFHADLHLLSASVTEDGKTLIWDLISRQADPEGTVDFGDDGVNLVVTPDDAGNAPASGAKLMKVTGLKFGSELTITDDNKKDEHLSQLETSVPAGFAKQNVISIFDVTVTPGGETLSEDEEEPKKIMTIQVTVNSGWSPANIRFIHYDTANDKWESSYLPSSYEKNVAGVYEYSVDVESFSPFAVVYAEPIPKTSSSKSQGTSIWLTAEPTPTSTPTPAPTPTPVPEAPQVKPIEQTPAAQSGASPVPFAGLLAGLGAAFAAAFVCRRR